MNLATATLMFTATAASIAYAAPVTELPFIENDYAAARVAAQQRKLPLLVEIWAPW